MPANEDSCLWKDITAELEAQIKGGAFEAEGRFPSASDISKRFSVSNITSRRVLAELSKMGLIDKGRGKGCWLKKKPENDEILITGDYIGGIGELNSNYIFSEILQGVSDATAGTGFKTTLVEPSYITDLMKSPLRKSPVNVIIMQCELNDAAAMRFLEGPEANVVLVHALKPHKNIFSIMNDFAGAAFLAVNALARKGRSKIAMLMFDGEWHYPRFDGYRQAVNELGLEFSMAWVENVTPPGSACAECVDKLLALSPRPDAIFAATDFLAIEAMKRLRERGLRVPEDIAVIGVDNRPEGRLAAPPLTTIDLQWRNQGRLAAETVIKRLSGDEKSSSMSVFQKPLLIERRSA